MKALLSMLVVFVVAQVRCARADELAIVAHGLQVRVEGVSKPALGDVKAVVEEQASLTDDKTVTPPLADDLAFFVRRRYRDLGYRDAVVRWEVASGAALLHVNEGQRYTFGERVSTNLFAEGSANQSESDKLTPDELGTSDYQLGAIGAGILLDYRDSPVLPSKGWMAGLTLTSASGDTSYLRGDAVFAYYLPITKKIRAAISAKSSVIENSGGVENLPIDLRVFNGGATSVHSFAEREMGPRARRGDTPLGGLMSQTASLELSYEVAPSLELAVFGDAGNLSDTVDNLFDGQLVRANLIFGFGESAEFTGEHADVGMVNIDAVGKMRFPAMEAALDKIGHGTQLD